jgi:hypothetical protein
MASQITCITKPDPQSTHEAITHVGGKRSSGTTFRITRLQCADDIDSRRDTYFVQVGRDHSWVTTYERNGVKFIRTEPDSTKRDNLLSLPQC